MTEPLKCAEINKILGLSEENAQREFISDLHEEIVQDSYVPETFPIHVRGVTFWLPSPWIQWRIESDDQADGCACDEDVPCAHRNRTYVRCRDGSEHLFCINCLRKLTEWDNINEDRT